MQQTFCDILYYIFILFFGVFSAMKLACGSLTRPTWSLYAVLCPILLLVQGILLEFCSIDWIWKLYPAITHLPIVLALILFLHVKWNTAFLSVIVSYSMCQMMRWSGLAVNIFCQIPMASLIIHLSLCTILLFLLNRYCLPPIHKVLCQSGKLSFFFGALPTLYYIYEYFMIYTQHRYAQIQAFQELLPTMMLLFFTLFTILFQQEAEKHRETEQQSFILKMKLDHAGQEVITLRTVEEQTAIYRHDMHHHLGIISAFLASNQPEQAAEYIRSLTDKIKSIVPQRYCDNNMVNLLLGSFQKKADSLGISLIVKASLPDRLCLNDTELCVILSNGLENALNAAAQLPHTISRDISILLMISRNKLLIEIRNPYAGSIAMQHGVPLAQDQRQHYGCRSILSVVQQRKGICSFDAEEGVFLLQIAIPLT